MVPNVFARRGRAWRAAAAALSVCGAAEAATVVEGDPAGPLTGIAYTWQITLEGADDGALVDGFVGSRSWAHPMNPGLGSFGLDAGWTHTSNWIYLVVEEERDVVISLAPSGDVPDGAGGFVADDLVPGFSLWAGADHEGMDDHYYAQGDVPHWIDAPGFAFLEHADAGPGPFDGSAAGLAVHLLPGEYTLAVGGHDAVAPSEHLVGYALSVPAPAAVLQALLGGALLGCARLLSGRARR